MTRIVSIIVTVALVMALAIPGLVADASAQAHAMDSPAHCEVSQPLSADAPTDGTPMDGRGMDHCTAACAFDCASAIPVMGHAPLACQLGLPIRAHLTTSAHLALTQFRPPIDG